MTIAIPASARNAFDGNMQSGSTVELPFPAPAFYIINGDAKLASLKNFQYFGGWACNTENLKAASESWENCPFPIPGFASENLPVDEGKEISVLASRSLIVAPIGMRLFSETKDQTGRKKRVPPFTKGARPAVQVVCVLAYRNESKQIVPWGPVMLTAKGYQVTYVQKAFADWKKAIAPFVKKLIPSAPEALTNLFYLHIGTFGAERKQELVGSGDIRKSITPIVPFIPENLNESQVENLYVGEPMAEFMADLSEKSKDWLKVFTLQPTAAVEHVEEYEPINQLPPEDDIPF